LQETRKSLVFNQWVIRIQHEATCKTMLFTGETDFLQFMCNQNVVADAVSCARNQDMNVKNKVQQPRNKAN
jgi:hypothetical protein